MRRLAATRAPGAGTVPLLQVKPRLQSRSGAAKPLIERMGDDRRKCAGQLHIAIDRIAYHATVATSRHASPPTKKTQQVRLSRRWLSARRGGFGGQIASCPLARVV